MSREIKIAILSMVLAAAAFAISVFLIKNNAPFFGMTKKQSIIISTIVAAIAFNLLVNRFVVKNIRIHDDKKKGDKIPP